MFENKETVENVEQFLETASNTFGSDFKEKISDDVARAKGDRDDFKIIVNTEKVFVTVLFSTARSVKYYSMSKKRKVIVEEFHICKYECKEMLELMGSVQEFREGS
ncbi:hypothetical protein ACQCVH_22425 [Bacillus infantis]|uniref:hypothetical protein n=1 Tax=Bacillus infantis TaxID=324767 RepID=UPI003CF47FB6